MADMLTLLALAVCYYATTTAIIMTLIDCITIFPLACEEEAPECLTVVDSSTSCVIRDPGACPDVQGGEVQALLCISPRTCSPDTWLDTPLKHPTALPVHPRYPLPVCHRGHFGDMNSLLAQRPSPTLDVLC
jgi:hypothetical protein